MCNWKFKLPTVIKNKSFVIKAELRGKQFNQFRVHQGEP